MKTKERDELYCGVDADKIAVASPLLYRNRLNLFMRFVKRRYRVHVKKDIKKLPAPWTKDKVLQQYRFTNIRREDDKVTRALIQQVSTNPDLSLEEKIINTFLFRSWNNPSTFTDFGGPWKKDDIYSSDRLKEKCRVIYRQLIKKDPKRKFWSAAYNQGGTKYAWKFPDGEGFSRAPAEKDAAKYEDYEADIPLRVFHIGPWLKQKDTVNRLLLANNQQEAFDIIREIRGFADFLAYQVFVDLTYIEEFPFSENEFTIAGPGCKRGLDQLFEDRAGLSYEECLFWLRDNWTALEAQVPESCRVYPESLFMDRPEYDRCMNVMSLENCFCEFSKYVKAVKGTGRPRQRYDGGSR